MSTNEDEQIRISGSRKDLFLNKGIIMQITERNP